MSLWNEKYKLVLVYENSIKIVQGQEQYRGMSLGVRIRKFLSVCVYMCMQIH